MPTPPEPATPPTPDTDRASQMILLAAHYELHAGQNPWLRSHLLGPWPSLFGLQLLTALAECELAASGLGFTLAADLARVPYGQGAKGRERFQNLLQKLIEIVALRTIVTAHWPEGTAFRHEPVNPTSGKKPELAVETPERLYLFEVKCPGLLDHQDNRHANPQQFPARSGFSESVRKREDWLTHGTTLPQDHKVKDFLVSAEEKFAGFQSDKPQTGVLVIAWDGFMYEPISSLRHPESGLFTDRSFFKDAAGRPAPFSAVDGVVILNHLALMHAATHGRRHRLRPDAFRIEPGSPSPNVWCPNTGGSEPPTALLQAFDAVPAEEMAQFADYAPQEFIFWTDPTKVARRHAAQHRKTARRYRPSPLGATDGLWHPDHPWDVPRAHRDKSSLMTADQPTPSGAESTEDPPAPVAVTNAARMTSGLRFENAGEPLRLTGINMCGISAAPARGGEQVDIWTRMSLTSADALFHHIVPSLADAIANLARAQGHAVSLSSHDWSLLVIRPDDTAELWLDAAAVVTETRLRHAEVEAGKVLFERDIADITGVWFPHVDIGAEDRIVCLFREGWRFGLLFDFGVEGTLDVARARRDLGTLLRRLRYAKLYAVVAHQKTFPALVGAGWFPFLELFSGEFETLASQLENGFELDTAEADLVARFDAARLDRMFARWMARPHLKAREPILRSGMDAFRAENAVATLKILLTEVEGVLSEACFAATGERTHRIPKLLDFVQTAAATRAGGEDTLFFPVEFASYLKDHTFAGFTPGAARSASRNAVGHGALPADQYTPVRALQALLTLDQLAFYT